MGETEALHQFTGGQGFIPECFEQFFDGGFILVDVLVDVLVGGHCGVEFAEAVADDLQHELHKAGTVGFLVGATETVVIIILVRTNQVLDGQIEEKIVPFA